MASYRVDAYLNALRTSDSVGNIVNVNRIYHDPNYGSLSGRISALGLADDTVRALA